MDRAIQNYYYHQKRIVVAEAITDNLANPMRFGVLSLYNSYERSLLSQTSFEKQ